MQDSTGMISVLKYNLNFNEDNQGHRIPGFPELIAQKSSLESINKNPHNT